MTDPFYIVFHFLFAAFDKCICGIINITGKHQILPNDQTFFIAQFKECIRWIITAAPDSDAVKMSFFRAFQQIILTFSGNSGIYTVFRNIVCAHGKNFDSIYLEGKFPPPFVMLSAHGQRAETNGSLFFLNHCFVTVCKRYYHIIKRLFSVSVRPPDPWIFYTESMFPFGISS